MFHFISSVCCCARAKKFTGKQSLTSNRYHFVKAAWFSAMAEGVRSTAATPYGG